MLIRKAALKFRLYGGKVIDPHNQLEGNFDILVENGKIARVTPTGSTPKAPPESGVENIDVSGKIVVPGLIDMHVHLREPGFEYKETIQTGSRAAAAGGFSSICCMPNTNPVNDSSSVTEYILNKAETGGWVNVFPIGAISKGLRGESLAEIGELKEAGVVAISDDGNPVMNSNLMRRALEYAKVFDLPVIPHCEDKDLSGEGLINEGFISTITGLPGIPAAAEAVMVARDIALAELTGWRLHIAHVSTAGAVRFIREAKARGVAVTAEATPHHFSLTEEAVKDYDTNTKVNPPLRSGKDLDAVKEGLNDGTIDVIASDHAPQSSVEKELEFESAENGIIGLETELSLSLKLVADGILSLSDVIAKLTINPARILRLPKGTLSEGADADISVIDLEQSWLVDPSKFNSKSRNTPFNHWELKGRAVMTIVGGKIVMRDGVIQE
ncbi:MAG: dihydroorotase [Deltaproteobacteria bacterium]|nr:MAG: dihydroorotase [Deltaproteobacteria bacterium]